MARKKRKKIIFPYFLQIWRPICHMTLLWKKLPIKKPLLPNPPLLSRNVFVPILTFTAQLLGQVSSLHRLLVMPSLRRLVEQIHHKYTA